MTIDATAARAATNTYAHDRAQQIKPKFITDLRAAAEYEELLAPKRQELAAEIAKLETAFNEANAELLSAAKAWSDSAATYEAELRQLAIDHFNECGEKTLDENLGVRVNTKFIYENDAAVEWAEKNAPVMIVKSVDRKSFESLPSTSALPFVTVEKNVSAVIKGLK